MSDPREDDRRSVRDRGSVMVVAALALVALVLFAALAVDVGVTYSARTQSQNADDSAALAAAKAMILQAPPAPEEVRTDLAIAEGKKFANLNGSVNATSVQVRDSDFEFGQWNLDTRTLDTSVDLTDPALVTGVRVKVAMDNSAGANKRSPTFLSQLLGRNGFEVNNEATAYLGFEGSWSPGEFTVPIAVDSCELSDNDGCGTDFCAHVEAPSTCPLEPPGSQTDTNGIVCGIFEPTGQQSMCWTAFDDKLSGVGELKDIIDHGNTEDIGAGDAVDLDNGTKTSAIDYLRDKMYGCGKFTTPAGQSRYGSPWAADSWVVKLPVLKCQRTDHCAGGAPVEITGGVCFEIREIVEPTPGKSCNAPKNGGNKSIKGRALCPNSPHANIRALYQQYCLREDDPPSSPGGCDFGIHAKRVVLVK